MLRHAETEPQQAGQSDFDRELLPKGINQIGDLAPHLSKIAFRPDSIICSPARRTKTTAMTLIELLKMPQEKVKFDKSIYTEEANGLLDLIHQTDSSSQSLLMIGHNPALSDLATHLVKGFADGLRTCDFVWIEFNTAQWLDISRNTGQLKKLIHATPLKEK